MTIYDIKAKVFNDLTNPMAFLTNKGFEDSAPESVQQYYGAFNFYGARGKWLVNTPPSKVIKADINAFKNEEHSITLDIQDKTWARQTRQSLIDALKIAHPHMEQSEIPIEQVIERCYIPDLAKLEIRSKYTARRSRVLQFINMYNGDNEITGKCNIGPGSVVSCSIRFSLTERRNDQGRIETGFKCDFGSGIRVHTLDGRPDAIKRPWDWTGVDFESLTMPMYNSVRVKTPAMQVATVGLNSVQVEAKSEFKKAIDDFHERAGADAWNQQIMTSPKKLIVSGDVAVATVVPKRNNQRIEWTAESIHTSRKKRRKMSASTAGDQEAVAAHQPDSPAAKMDGDNTGNFSDTQTNF